jgi:hypothetical protein
MISCGSFSLIGTAGDTAGIYPLRCKLWRCRGCGQRKVKATIARVHQGMKLGDSRFFTITSPGDEGRDASYKAFPERWKRFHERIRRRFGAIEYIAVVEPQKRGAAHIHVVYRGPFIPQRWLSAAAAGSGFGKIADIRRPPRQVATYLAKYLTKELRDPFVAPPRYFRRVRWTKGWSDWKRPDRPKRWEVWWLADAIPPHAEISALRRGFEVVEVVSDDWSRRFDPVWSVQWLRDLRGYRPSVHSIGLLAAIA